MLSAFLGEERRAQGWHAWGRRLRGWWLESHCQAVLSVAEAEAGHSGCVPHRAENDIHQDYRRHGWLGTQQWHLVALWAWTSVSIHNLGFCFFCFLFSPQRSHSVKALEMPHLVDWKKQQTNKSKETHLKTPQEPESVKCLPGTYENPGFDPRTHVKMCGGVGVCF